MKQSLTQMFLEAEAKEANNLLAINRKPSTPMGNLRTPDSQQSLSRWSLRPDEPIPEQYVDVLKTWSAVRNHPAWKGHPQL